MREAPARAPRAPHARGVAASFDHQLDQERSLTREAGAQEINDLGETFEIVSEASDLVEVRNALQNAKIDYDSADSSFLPTMSIPVTDPETAKKLFDLIDAIEESDEVQNVYGNFDVSDEVMEKAASL